MTKIGVLTRFGSNQRLSFSIVLMVYCLSFLNVEASGRQTIKSLYTPSTNHSAVLVAFERYGEHMIHADFQIEQKKNWDLLQAYLQSGDVGKVGLEQIMDFVLEEGIIKNAIDIDLFSDTRFDGK